MLRVAVSSPRFILTYLSNKTPHSIQRTDKLFRANKNYDILKRDKKIGETGPSNLSASPSLSKYVGVR